MYTCVQEEKNLLFFFFGNEAKNVFFVLLYAL